MSPLTTLRLCLSGCAALAAALTLSAPVAAATKKQAAPPAPVALEELSPEQLANADRVLVGASACEFNQSVAVHAMPAKQGYFQLMFKGKTYVMAPEPTSTGAIRLEDKKNGIVWLQIPAKSMLMNAKIGQRMVDNCVSAGQGS